MINRTALEKIHSYTEIGNDEGAKLLTGGEIATENGLDKGFFYRPTVFGDVEPDMRIAQEEIFGPTTALIRATDVDEAIRIANGIEYGLSSSIFTRDVNKAFKAMRDLNAGITYVNAGTTGAEVHLPFGGTKGHGQRPPRGGPGRARLLHRVEVASTSTTPASSSGPRSTRSSPDPQACRLRAARGARRRPRRRLRRRGRPHRRVRALLLVRGGHRHVPRR